ncbi:MAG: HAMP domain-containing histidine kinase, partial [Lachnospiraceae bacterium]|nr:HAMP domain-containing histidine kinase [Lachnospiraceae bacterium]
MKNNYRKLKFSILLQTVLVTALTVLVGGFILDYVIDGIYNDSFAEMFVEFVMSLGMKEESAIRLYWQLIGNNKMFFIIVGFLLLFAMFYYVALSKMMKYVDQIGDGIENILSESTKPIHLITELKPIEIRLNEIKATLKRQEIEAEEGEKKKNDLVLFLAHDLKTPLTSIVAYLSMLDSHVDMQAEEREKYTHIALEKSIRLGELINEFFDITRYNFQDIELEAIEINLSFMLEQLADELYGVLQEKHLSCEVHVEENLVVYGDPDKLARVFDNILRNAIAYCYENTKIQIDAQNKNRDVEIVFTNQGDKIPGTMLQTIFEKFYRVDGSRSSGTGGAGLGLAIAKEIVELHGGRIRAKSDDIRTQFIVDLPLKTEEEGAT